MVNLHQRASTATSNKGSNETSFRQQKVDILNENRPKSLSISSDIASHRNRSDSTSKFYLVHMAGIKGALCKRRQVAERMRKITGISSTSQKSE